MVMLISKDLLIFIDYFNHKAGDRNKVGKCFISTQTLTMFAR